MVGFKNFLEQKSESYANIDIRRMPSVWQEIKELFSMPKTVHIVGTNGKGSTGRFLATMLKNLGFRVGHYTSPHILRFNERIWIDGKHVSDDELEDAHCWLQNLLREKVGALSYFEYATLLAFRLFERVDFVILEAGLGGEYDATTVAPRDISLFTTIGFDHLHILGDTIEDIAMTKLKSMAKSAIIGVQNHQEVNEIAKSIALEKGSNLYFANELVQQKQEIEEFMSKKVVPSYQQDNLLLAVAGLTLLGFTYKVSLCDGFYMPARCQKVAENITIDVGHNPLSAQAIVKEFYGKSVVLVYNTFADKDFKAIIKILKPIIKRVEIIQVESERIIGREHLLNELRLLGIECLDFKEIKKSEEYLVYGSFSVVQKFIEMRLCEIDT